MISIWDLIIGGGYPAQGNRGVYFIIGIISFVLSIILALFTLPFLIYLLEKYYKLIKKIPLGPGGGIRREKQHEFDYFRIVMVFLISDMFVLLLTVILSAHGIYFISNINKYQDYLYQFVEESNHKMTNVYDIPIPHYILYVLQALFEAAQENLLLWGFMFLANYICKLINRPFYFYTFTSILFIRVVIAFVSNLNIWELILNTKYPSNFYLREIGLAAYPFHIFPKSIKGVWLVYSLIVFVPFAVYLHRLLAQRLRSLTPVQDNLLGDDSEDDEDEYDVNADEITQIKLVKKYFWLYTAFLVVNLIVTIFECHFPSFALQLAKNHEDDINTVTILIMTVSVVSDFLNFTPSLIFLSFLTIFGYTTLKKVRRLGEQDRDEDMPRDNRCRRFLMLGSIILIFSFCCTGMIGYLRFSVNDFFPVTLMPGDFIKIDGNINTSYSRFSGECDTLQYSRTPPYVLTQFDFLSSFYHPEDYSATTLCPNSKDLGFYKNFQQKGDCKEQIEISDPLNVPIMWFPAGTKFSNFRGIPMDGSWPLNFSYVHYPYPCYKDYNELTPNKGLEVICSSYSKLEENPSYLLCNTKNTTNACYLEQDSIIFYECNQLANYYNFTVFRPNITGNGRNQVDEIVNSGKDLKTITFITLKYRPNEDAENYEKNRCTFFIVCHNKKIWASLMLIGIFIFTAGYLILSQAILSKLLSPYFI